jgi:hypothetical protein
MMARLNLAPKLANGAKNLRMVPDDADGMTVKDLWNGRFGSRQAHQIAHIMG